MPTTRERLSSALAGRYRIERELGQGGMATVYLAEDLTHKRKVALRVLKPGLAAALGAERFLREIAVTATLQHPHILPLFDSGLATALPDATGGEVLYYVTSYVEGETLRDRLTREPSSPSPTRSRSRRPLRAPWNLYTDAGSSTATSSPRISCCRTGLPSSRTSGLRSP